MPNKTAVRHFFENASEIFWERNAKYGTKNITELGPEGVLHHIADKLGRLRSTLSDPEADHQTCDALYDIANYALILRLLLDGDWDEDAGRDIKRTPKAKVDLLIKRDDAAKAYPLPGPKKAGDVGYDLTTTEATIVPRSGVGAVHIPSGLAMKLPAGCWAEIRPRSSAAKRGIIVVPCVIDEGYTGPLFTQAYNLTEHPITVDVGERVAQVVIHRSCVPSVVEVDELPETERGATGFGSTGK